MPSVRTEGSLPRNCIGPVCSGPISANGARYKVPERVVLSIGCRGKTSGKVIRAGARQIASRLELRRVALTRRGPRSSALLRPLERLLKHGEIGVFLHFKGLLERAFLVQLIDIGLEGPQVGTQI